MLVWNDVSHSFGPFEVISGISLDLRPGRVLSLVGPSGCGKSTLLQMAAGLLEPGRGSVVNSFAGTACVFQEPRLLPWRLAIDNLAFGLCAAGVGKMEGRRRAREIGRRLGLGEADLEKYPHELSGGMRQRVSLGRALAVKPDLLLLDEPFSALDVGLRRELQNLLIKEIEERSLSAVFITHDLAEAVRVSHEIAVIDHAPQGVVRRMDVDLPFGRRDDGFVYERVAAMLADPLVADVFHRSHDGSLPPFSFRGHPE